MSFDHKSSTFKGPKLVDPQNSNIIPLNAYKRLKKFKKELELYEYQIQSFDKSKLLNELLRYHEEYRAEPYNLYLTLKGRILMNQLEAKSELKELRELSQELQRKIDARLQFQMKLMS